MTTKRFYLMNVEDPLHEYGRWCKPVLEDGLTGKQYEGALEVMGLLNEQHETIQQQKEAIEHLSYDCEYLKNNFEDKCKENEELKSEINMLKITIGRNEGYIDRLNHKGEWR